MNAIMDLFSLNGKNAVVTGANTGLGQGICVALAAAGAHVFGVARRSCDETAAKIAAEGGQFTEVRADLSDFSVINSILEQVHAHADRIDILVNNAGIIKRCDAIDVTPENWDAVDFLNEKMVFFLSQAVAKQWVADKKGGKIINIASMLSFQGGIRVPAYTSSKSAVMGMTKALANEWAKYGINVNAIGPGLHGHQQHQPAAPGRRAQRGDPRPHPSWPLGHPCRCGRCGYLPGIRCRGLRERLHPGRRRRLAGPLKKFIKFPARCNSGRDFSVYRCVRALQIHKPQTLAHNAV